MGSESSETVEHDVSNLAVDKSATLGQGQQIVDSIIQNTDPEVVAAALQPLLAAWETQSKTGTLNLLEITDLGAQAIQLAEKGQIAMSDNAMGMLREGVELFQSYVQQNKLTIDLVEGLADQSFDQSDRALEMVAKVKTGDFASLSKSIMIFALLSLGITGWVMTKGK